TTVIRAVRAAGNLIEVFVNDLLYIWTYDGTLNSGQPGVGARGTPSGNSISEADFGSLDRVAPNAFNMSLIGSSSFPNRVDLQWAGTGDNVNGTGIAEYTIIKNGNWIGLLSPTSTTYSDATLSPSTSYTYIIAATDFHGNTVYSSSIPVTTPPSG